MKEKLVGICNGLITVAVLAVVMIVSLIVAGIFSTNTYAADAGGYPVSPDPNTDINIKVLVAAIDPYITSLDGSKYGNGSTTIRASEYTGFSLSSSVNYWITNIEESSHNTVNFQVVDTVILNEFPKYKNMTSLNNATYQGIFTKGSNGYSNWYLGINSSGYKQYDKFGDLDYYYYIDKLNLVNRRNAGDFDMVLLIGIDPLSPDESCIVGRKPMNGNGGAYKADCDNFIIITPTFSRKDGSIENLGHHAERFIGYTYGQIPYIKGIIDGSNYSKLNDWQKYCLCEFLAKEGSTNVYGYGMVHFSPNSTKDYDWQNNTPVKYYKDWKNGKDEQIFTSDVYMKDTVYREKNGDATVSHHRWWFMNMPYANGRDVNGYYKSWWRYIFTPDYVIKVTPQSSIINLEIGQSASVKFDIQYYSEKIFATDILSSGAAVVNNNKNVISVTNGKVVAKQLGSTTVDIKIDGKTATITVNVVEHMYEATSGTAQHKCTLCGAIENHKYNTTCKNKCSVCGKENADSKHVAVVDEAISPTCYENGKTEGSHCKYCGTVLVKQETIYRTSHMFVIDPAVEPTCYREGLTKGMHCVRCNLVQTKQETLPKTEHTVVTSETIEPTCTKDGQKGGTHCSVCGTVIKSPTVLPATGHFGVIDKAVPATTTSTGLTEGSHCSVCKKILVEQKVIPKLSNPNPFVDVKDKEFFAQAVIYLNSKKIMTGYTANTFAPYDKLDRAMAVTVLWRAVGKPEVYGRNTFPDVKSTDYFYKAVNWAYTTGVVTGYTNGYFGSHDNITRQDFALILKRFALKMGYSTQIGSTTAYMACPDYKKVSAYAISGVQWAYNNGIIGKGGTLAPQSQITRGETATMIKRILDKFGIIN